LDQEYELTLIIIVCILLAIILEERYDHNMESSVEIIAHRGASLLAPENTMAAFEKAIDYGIDRIKFDVQLSKDSKLVVIHDHTVDRTTNGSGYVKDFTLRDLKKLDAGSWFSEEFYREKIPTFNEVLKKYSGKVNFLVEIK
jgi:glycerophosphoryl diester phosphodiesterase